MKHREEGDFFLGGVVGLGVMGLEGIGMSLLRWAFIEGLMDAL